MTLAYRIVLICWALPLIAGVAIFVLWLLTRWEGWVLAGVVNLYVGLAGVIIGGVALVVFCWLGQPTLEPLAGRTRRRAIVGGLLLVSNFPVAAAIIAAVVAIESLYTVVVHNASPAPLDQVRVSGGGVEVSFGSLAPGATARRSFWVQHEGSLTFEAISGASRYTALVDEYVTNSMGGHSTVTIEPDGRVTVVPPPSQAAD